jgi:PST family polysaccharide transporter
MHRRELRPAHVTTAFTLSAGFGLLLALLTGLAARPISGYFHEPRLTAVLLAVSVTFVCKGVQGVPRDMLRRDLRFVPYAVTATVALLIGVVVGTVAGVMGAGVWALVLYTIVESIAGLVLSLFAARRAGVWQPAVGIERVALRDLAGFASYMVGSRGLVYVQNTADNFIVGRFLGASALGFYGLAYRTMLVPVQKVADVVSNVAIPAFAVVQQDLPRLRAAFLRAQQAAAVVSFPMSFGVMVVAPVAIPVLMGSQWRPAVGTVQILALNGPRLVLGRLADSLFQATGRPSWDFRMLTVSVPLSVAAFAIGAQHGIAGVAAALTIVGTVLLVVQLLLVARALRTAVVTLLRNLMGVVIATAALTAAALAVRAALPDRTSDAVELVLAVLAGAVAYILALAVLAPGTMATVAADVFRRRQPAGALEAVRS